MQDTAAAARAEHCCLLKETVFLHDVYRAAIELLRQRIFDELRAKGRTKSSAQAVANWL